MNLNMEKIKIKIGDRRRFNNCDYARANCHVGETMIVTMITLNPDLVYYGRFVDGCNFTHMHPHEMKTLIDKPEYFNEI